MSQCIVDRFEPIQIQTQHSNGLAAPQPGHRLIQTQVKKESIGEAGQRVVMRHVLHVNLRSYYVFNQAATKPELLIAVHYETDGGGRARATLAELPGLLARGALMAD